MEITAGYLKDALATLLFIIVIVIIIKYYNKNGTKQFLLSTLLIAFSLDLTYTLYPEYHNELVGYNRPSYLLFLCSLVIIYLLFSYILY
tara:strand:- start:2409 stop:2675 length:267 start_codon:yes stop_codon:yes gene_type:complete